MSDDLSAYLAAMARRRFVYGESDCLLFLAGWVEIVHGVDPAAYWRGRYHDAASCRALLIAERGSVALMETALAPLGIARTSAPGRGDIGLVRAPVLRGERVVLRRCGAICVMPDMWALMTDRGLVIARLAPSIAWSCAGA